jgi:hypothetical protein
MGHLSFFKQLADSFLVSLLRLLHCSLSSCFLGVRFLIGFALLRFLVSLTRSISIRIFRAVLDVLYPVLLSRKLAVHALTFCLLLFAALFLPEAALN